MRFLVLFIPAFNCTGDTDPINTDTAADTGVIGTTPSTGTTGDTGTTSATEPTGDTGTTSTTEPTGDTGTTSTTTDTGLPGSPPTSCLALPGTCAGGDCCESLVVPTSSFALGRGLGDADDCVCTACDSSCGTCGPLVCEPDEQDASAATVSSFRLDRYEVTVGRFRAFVAAGAPAPAPGAGKHTHLPGGELAGETGWDATWPLSSNWDYDLWCSTNRSTWTSTSGANEELPLNCATWYEAYAFCTWDGGFLPTEAEFELAASGGEERVYPWSVPPDDDTLTLAHATHDCMGDGAVGCLVTDILPVGSAPAGAGRWGQDDLAGSMREWLLDLGVNAYPQPDCVDCVDFSGPNRVLRGGDWTDHAEWLRAAFRWGNGASGRSPEMGFRCARTP